jgi:hypothetical protein
MSGVRVVQLLVITAILILWAGAALSKAGN